MPVILKRPVVIDDLAEIWSYIAVESEKRADALIDTFDWKFKEIAECPVTGKNRDELYRGLMSLPIGRHIVFYLIIPEGIEVIRVLHAAREVSFQFEPDI
ncbi:MAG: type II toxin-antitoxin system RelE/ParE family toxin [Chlorobiaceae bacterium]|nr:type II toxin-antitoxin system RelE/ParE family toxin [Chlorobiaceae bacterium]